MANDYYINDLRPLDPPEAFDLPDGKEEWVAEKANEIAQSAKLMKVALEWDCDQTGAEDVFGCVAMYVASYHTLADETEAQENLLSVSNGVAERYAEFVLFPAMLEGLKNG